MKVSNLCPVTFLFDVFCLFVCFSGWCGIVETFRRLVSCPMSGPDPCGNYPPSRASQVLSGDCCSGRPAALTMAVVCVGSGQLGKSNQTGPVSEKTGDELATAFHLRCCAKVALTLETSGRIACCLLRRALTRSVHRPRRPPGRLLSSSHVPRHLSVSYKLISITRFQPSNHLAMTDSKYESEHPLFL